MKSTPRTQVRFLHSGDLGDIIYAIPVIREAVKVLGDVQPVLVCGDRPITKAMVTRIPLIKDLLISAGLAVEKEAKQHIDYDLAHFRKYHNHERTLAEAQWLYLLEQIPELPYPDLSPWLPSKPRKSGKKLNIIVARSSRYTSSLFPWKPLVEEWGDTMQFVGLEEEHYWFTQSFGPVKWLKTKCLEDVRVALEDADWFFGNQSSPLGIAIGMGKPSLVECSPVQPDCIYPGPFQYFCGPKVTWDGKVFRFPEDLELLVNQTMQPPGGGWTDPDTGYTNPTLLRVSLMREKEQKIPLDQARREIMRHTVDLHPSFFRGVNSGQERIDGIVNRKT